MWLKKLWQRLVRWWWRRPKPVKRFKSEVSNMSNVLLSWALPTPSVRQRPISHVQISARVAEDLPWTEIAIVLAPGAEVLIQDVAPGDWFYQAVVVDEEGQESAPAFASASIAFDAPSAVTAFVATVA